MTVKELIQNLGVYHPELPLYGSVPISDYNFPISNVSVTDDETELVMLFGVKEKPLKVSEVISKLQTIQQDDYKVMIGDGNLDKEECLCFPALSLADLPPEGKCTKIVVCADLTSGGEEK